MTGGNSVVRWRTRTSMLPTSARISATPSGAQSDGAVRSVPLWKFFDFDPAEANAAGVGLQADETRRGVGFAAIGIGVDEIRLLLAVQQDREAVVLDADFIRVPLPGAVCGDALIERLAGDIVDRARGAEFRIDVLARRRLAAPERIDLQFEAEIDRDEGGVVVVDARRVGEAKKNAGIIVVAPRQPFELEHVVDEIDLAVEQPKIGTGLGFKPGLDDMEDARIVAAWLTLDRVHLPACGGRPLEQEREARAWLRPRPPQCVAQPPREGGAGQHRVGRALGRKQRRA